MIAGTLVLDSEGLSKAVVEDRSVMLLLRQARDAGSRVITSAATLVEARDSRLKQARFDWTLSRLHIEPVSESIARHASKLLAAAQLHGHKYAIDAIVCATALAEPGRVAVLTSDPDDIEQIRGPHLRIFPVKV